MGFVKVALFTAIAVFWGTAWAAFEQRETDPVFMGRGGSGLVWQGGGMELFYNPALIAQNDSSRGHVALSVRNYYGIPGLYQSALAGGKGYWQAGLWQFGNQRYRETMVSLAAVYDWQKSVFLGVAINAQHLYVKNYGTRQGIAAVIGTVYELQKWRFAMTARNINLYPVTQDWSSLSLSLGAGWQITPEVRLMIDQQWQEPGELEVRLGMEWTPVTWLTLRTGWQSLSAKWALGFTLWSGAFFLSYGVEYHPELKYSHLIGVKYAL